MVRVLRASGRVLAMGFAFGFGCAETTSGGAAGAGIGGGGASGGAGLIATAGQGGAGAGAMAGANAGEGGAAGGGAGRAGSGGVAGMSGAGGLPAGAGSAGSGPDGPPTFTRVWREVLVAKGCSGEFCHGGAQGGLSLDSQADAYANLVDKPAAGPACGTSGKARVKSGDPMQSLLLQKMAGPTAPCGELMPIGVKYEPNCISMDPSVCTTQRELQLVRAWILAGAKND